MANLTLLAGAEPYFHRGDNVGCLCLHGFTASPHEVLWLSQYLAGQGYTVYAPRLAGHGTHHRDLIRTRWHDWLNSTLDGYHVLRQQCDQVFIVGLSMGGVLALLASMHVPVDGVAVLAAPLLNEGLLRTGYLRPAKYVLRYTDQTDRGPFAQYILDQQRQRGEPEYGRVRYGIWSTAAVEQLALLVKATRERLREVNAPLLLVYSEADITVHPRNQAFLAAHISSTDVEQHTLKRSGHILTQDVEHTTVFGLVGSFIKRLAT